ncbi:MAG TPA: PhzF family phenazine biosynthesis protein, partial [Clostridiales bacterium UBA8153]|nr:PhzF family phenazine biosynthesis protein [Clostridiales bacterium UBA8153]
ATMQSIAREMALSETAFVFSPERGGDCKVRFFTPTSEVDLCGHATVAAFHLLSELGTIGRPSLVVQETRAGLLTVAVGEDGLVMMDQTVPEYRPFHHLDELVASLGNADIAGEPSIVSTGLYDLIVPIRDRAALWAIRPDFPRLAKLCQSWGVTSVHAFTLDTLDPAHTVHCRDFAPAVGIPEEAATGTASGATAAYLVRRRLVPTGPQVLLTMEQGDILGRPSLIQVVIDLENEAITRVRVGGRAVTVIEGTLRF